MIQSFSFSKFTPPPPPSPKNLFLSKCKTPPGEQRMDLKYSLFNIWITWRKWEAVGRHAKMLSTPHMFYWPSGRTSGLIRPRTRLISIHHYWTSLVNKVFILKKMYSLEQDSRMPTIMARARLSFLGFDWSLSLFILWFHCQLTGFHLTHGHC